MSIFKIKLFYSLVFAYKRNVIVKFIWFILKCVLCLKTMPSVSILYNLLLKPQSAGAHSYFLQSVTLANFILSVVHYCTLSVFYKVCSLLIALLTIDN